MVSTALVSDSVLSNSSLINIPATETSHDKKKRKWCILQNVPCFNQSSETSAGSFKAGLLRYLKGIL